MNHCRDIVHLLIFILRISLLPCVLIGYVLLLIQWLVLEARKLSKELRDDDSDVSTFAGNEGECKMTVDALDAFGYDEAAEIVYGESYLDWKKRHQKSASEAQL